MRLRNTTVLTACLTVLGAAFLSAPAQEIFVANSSNGRISVFDTSGAATPFTGDTSSLTTPLGIALDSLGRLVVCDNKHDRLVRYELAGGAPVVIASEVPRPDGPSFGPGGDLFFVTSPDGATSSKLRDVYVLPGGSGPAVKIASLRDSRLLRDTKIVPAGPYAGHLLVLSGRPAFIARFSPATPTSWLRESNFVASLPDEATGMAFTPTGDLLVAGIEGNIRRFDSSGNRLTDFSLGLGNGPTRIAVSGDGTVYVTNRNHPTLFRFDSTGMRLSDFGGTLQSPAGVAVHEFASTPVGRNVTVTPIPGVSATYDEVVEAGFTTAEKQTLDEGQRTTPCGNVIPAFATLPAGDGAFTVTRVETTAGFIESIALEFFHPDGNSRLFHAACPPDAAGFEDVTTLAVPGDPRGRVPQFSEFVVVADTRPNSEVIRVKRESLMMTVAPGSPADQFIDSATLAALRMRIGEVGELVFFGNTQGAIEELQRLKDFVRANSGTTIPSSAISPGGNIAGRIVSLAATLQFSLGL